MPEILTESFCERCGTRYTFESAAPKQKRLGRFKVLSQGFKNFVMSDDTSLDEAFAAARNDEEREAVTQQLDAFHKTFNFCMNCRQYTCSNCWNEVEGRCLTCAPHLGHEVLPAPFRALETNGNGAGVEEAPRLDGLAWPTLDLPPESASPTAELAWPETAEVAEAEAAVTPPPSTREDGLPDWATLVPDESPPTSEEPEFAPPEPADLETLLTHPAPAPEETAPTEVPADESPIEVAETGVEPAAAEALEPVVEAPEPVVEAPEPVVAEAAEPDTAEAPEPVVAEPEVAEPLVAEPVAETAEPESPMGERVAAASAQTADLLSRFRPGQSIDAALEEYEAALAAQDAAQTAPAETTAEPELVAEPVVEAETPPESAVEPVAAIHETPLDTEPATPLDEVLAEEPPLEAEIAAAITEAAPEPAAAEPAAPEPAEPEPVAAIEATPAEPTPEPSAPRTPADDRVEVPVWRIVAPDTPVPTPDSQPAETNMPAAASADPQWPQTPAWPGQESQVDVSFLAARLSRKPANDALWAASSRDVVAPLPQQPAAPAVQTCVSCGLSLSATARFCRRCGSRQGA
jgi:hypothetical protein